MARPMYASFLPTIKCSNCGAEIEISAMGDHLCTGDPADAEPQMGRSDHDRIPASHLQIPSYLMPSPPVDQRRPLQTAPSPAPGVGFGSQPLEMRMSPAPSPIATTPSSESVPPSSRFPTSSRPEPPVRSATDSILSAATKPTPDQASQQDAATPAGRSLTRPNAPASLSLRSDSSGSSDPNTRYGPLSSSLNSGPTILKRMNSIAPGPFNARSRSYEERNGPLSPLPPTSTRTSASESRSTPSISVEPLKQPQRPDSRESLYEERHQGTDISKHGTIDEAEVEPVAPLPQFSQSNRGHSLTESESSTASQSVSDSRTASSTSSHSPITSNSSSSTSYKLSTDQNFYAEQKEAPTSSPTQSFEVTSGSRSSGAIQDGGPAKSSIAARTVYSSSSHSNYSLGQERSSSMTSSQPLVESEQRLSSLRYDPTVANGRASGPMIVPPRDSVAKRRPAASKGKCRGCNLAIIGKSIKAADGRLSGRWHRECFMCHTCKTPFETADFYVLNDQPYCAHHYHVLNKSLCHKCNNGIEGKYLETQPSQKYHVDCFACHDCQRPLTKDYFEMNHQFYCEADAFRVWQKSKMLTPGRRFPERRTTRLMTMS